MSVNKRTVNHNPISPPPSQSPPVPFNAHISDGGGRGTDERHPRRLTRLRELRVLREKAVAGMDRLGAAALSNAQDPVGAQVRLLRGGRPDVVCLVRLGGGRGGVQG